MALYDAVWLPSTLVVTLLVASVVSCAYLQLQGAYMYACILCTVYVLWYWIYIIWFEILLRICQKKNSQKEQTFEKGKKIELSLLVMNNVRHILSRLYFSCILRISNTWVILLEAQSVVSIRNSKLLPKINYSVLWPRSKSQWPPWDLYVREGRQPDLVQDCTIYLWVWDMKEIWQLLHRGY